MVDITNTFNAFNAIQGVYYISNGVIFRRTGASTQQTPSNLYDGTAGWTRIVGLRVGSGFTVYAGDPHTFNNNSEWKKYTPGSTLYAVKDEIWYYAGKAYRYVDATNKNGIGSYIQGTDFTNTSLWDPVCTPTSTFTPYEIKTALTSAPSDAWVNGELYGTQPTGSLPGMTFCDARYRYEYVNGMADTNGRSYVWVRLLKAI
jgi:hypothetical protein